jgi:dihydroxy-acid dehydratase
MSGDQRPLPLRSAEWFSGTDEVALLHRAALRSIGIEVGVDADRPIIGIANTSSELNPCNLALSPLVESVKRGVWTAGGIPLEFPVISLGEELMKPSAMLYRNLMAIEVEEMIRSHPLDGVVLLANCDKTLPAVLMGAASADVPAIVVTGGPRAAGTFRGRALGSGTDLWRYWEEFRTGTMSQTEWGELQACLGCSIGACNTMGTASTMAVLTETMGMMLPGGSTIPAGDSRRLVHAEQSGRRAVEMVLEGLVPSAILTPAAFENAIVVLAGVGGSTNAVIHMCAIAGRRAIDLSLQRVADLAAPVPLIADVAPVGSGLMADVDAAGGTPAILAELASFLRLDALTVSGGILRDAINGARHGTSSGVVRTLSSPLSDGRNLRVLWGTLAPDGAVLKAAAASPELFDHRGPALVFHNYHDMRRRLEDPHLQVTRDTVLVFEGCGPRAVPGMPEWGMVPIPAKLAADGVRDMVRVCDGRMSGTSYGTVVLHVAPEGAAGGPIGLVQDGDLVHLDVEGGRIDLEVSPAVLAQRSRPALDTEHLRGWPKLYRDHVLQAPQGCDLDFLRATTASHLRFVPPIVGRS